MSTTYNGEKAAITNSTAKTVSGATNASPIVITTSTSHTFHDGDTVVIASVGGNTAANGTWTISVLTSTTFELDGSTGSGAYTSGGTATDVSMLPAATVPSDGDDLTAASIVPALENILDKLAFLAAKGLGMNYKIFTANGTWTAPANVGPVGFVYGYGNGGSGAGGAAGTTATNAKASGGGGGAGALASVLPFFPTASTAYSIAGIAATTGGAAGADGNDGADVTFGSGATGLTFCGGGKGKTGSITAATTTWSVGQGGIPSKTGVRLSGVFTDKMTHAPGPSCGGDGVDEGFTAINKGWNAPNGQPGGNVGGIGASSSTSRGGGPGGGGGGGPGGAGGNGGAGGGGDNSGAAGGSGGSAGAIPSGINGGTDGGQGTAGANGSGDVGGAGGNGGAAGANSGAGGGGGGGGGCGTSGGGSGGTGGVGGSGKLIVFYFGDPT
jgi:hypothetical protein